MTNGRCGKSPVFIWFGSSLANIIYGGAIKKIESIFKDNVDRPRARQVTGRP